MGADDLNRPCTFHRGKFQNTHGDDKASTSAPWCSTLPNWVCCLWPLKRTHSDPLAESPAEPKRLILGLGVFPNCTKVRLWVRPALGWWWPGLVLRSDIFYYREGRPSIWTIGQHFGQPSTCLVLRLLSHDCQIVGSLTPGLVMTTKDAKTNWQLPGTQQLGTLLGLHSYKLAQIHITCLFVILLPRVFIIVSK